MTLNTLDPILGDDLDTFLVRLNQTIQWCSRPGRGNDPQTSFRSAGLEPWLWAKGRKDLVAGVAESRRYRLGKHDKSPATNLANGRLLVYWPDESASDGNTDTVTKGFFTIWDTPAWDTWVAYFHETEDYWGRDYLICWIPPDFVQSVSEAVRLSAERCVRWLDEEPWHLVYQLLKERNFY